MSSFAKVIPNLRLSRNLNEFDYIIPDKFNLEIKPGSFVEINFRKKKMNGLVVKINNTSTINKNKLKAITKNHGNVFITNNQRKLIDYLSQEFYISKSLALKTLLPPIIYSDHGHNIPIIKPDNKIRNFSLNKKKILLIKNFLLKPRNKPSFIFTRVNNEKIYFYLELLKKTRNGQVLIIVPEIIDINKILDYLPDNILKQTIILHSNLKNTQYYNNWQTANKAKLIIGTKQAIFCPFDN